MTFFGIHYSPLDKNTDAMEYLTSANTTSDWACGICVKLYSFIVFSNLTMVLTSVLICWTIKGHFDTNFVGYASRVVLVISVSH